MDAIATVDKLNKGTSRDQWGTFGYWGFKTSNGLIRCRVLENGSLTVKLFDPANLGSYRKVMQWSEAHTVGTSFVEIQTVDDKGPDSKFMIPEVNAIIEGYNDTLARWVGKHVQDSTNAGDKDGMVVETVTVNFDKDAELSVVLSGNRRGYSSIYRQSVDANNARVVTIENYAGQLKDAITDQQTLIRTAQDFLMDVNIAVESGKSMKEIEGYGGSKGSISWNEAKKIVDLVNKLATDKVEVPNV